MAGSGKGVTKYKKEYAEQARKLCLLGLIDEDLAAFFEVAESTLNLWKKKHPEFKQAIHDGKLLPNAEVADAVYKSALGYEHDETYVNFHNGKYKTKTIKKRHAPNMTAAIFFLKNRTGASMSGISGKSLQWKDKQEHELTGENGTPLVPVLNVTIAGDKS